MEEKQLNFNQPLLSVRRSSSTVVSVKDEKRKTDNSVPNTPRLPSYKSELKSGPIRNPGTVPFVWEQSPGRPKGENKPRNYAIEHPPIAPKLPPGRILKPKHQNQDSDKVSQNSSAQCVQSSDENITKTDIPKPTRNDIRMEGSSDSEDGDEEYLDALDTLSRTDSFFLNCSASGVSGLDGPDSKPIGSVPMDPQARDFMMGRFLPAAKAMASETPQHAPRKQPVTWEKLREVKKVVNGSKRAPLRYRPNVIPHYAQESAEEESDNEYEEHAKLSANICGLIPRFCLKGSVGFLNPVPAMSMRTRVPTSHVSRSHVSSSSAGSCSEIENKLAMVANYEQQSVGGPQKAMQHEDTSCLKNESTKINSEGIFHKIEGLKLYSRLQGSDKSPSHKESPRSFQELLADQNGNGETETKTESETGSLMVEKTLYVDTIHKVESPIRNVCSSDLKGLPKLRGNDFKFLAKTKAIEDTLSVDSSFKEIENSSITYEEAKLQSKVKKPIDIYQDFDTLKTSNLPANVNLDFSEVENLENSHKSKAEFPVPPPLPKSPSDSWLWRTLPSVSLKNPNSRLYYSARNNPINWASNTNNTKREGFTISTKGQHQHLQFSEELLVPIPEI